MATETPRVALYQRLTEVLGPDHASTLMTYLPTDEPATKTDILAVKSAIQDVKSAIAELKSEIRDVEQRLGRRIDGIETRLNQHDLRFDSVHEAMRQQTRSFILASTSMMVTLSAVAFGAASLI